MLMQKETSEGGQKKNGKRGGKEKEFKKNLSHTKMLINQIKYKISEQ